MIFRRERRETALHHSSLSLRGELAPRTNTYYKGNCPTGVMTEGGVYLSWWVISGGVVTLVRSRSIIIPYI